VSTRDGIAPTRGNHRTRIDYDGFVFAMGTCTALGISHARCTTSQQRLLKAAPRNKLVSDSVVNL
jgi:hypothetical protein